MDSNVFVLYCNECRLMWHLSLMEFEPGRAIACPFCGNRQFRWQPQRLGPKSEPDNSAAPENPTARAAVPGERIH